jgi:AcrR family transcriptional regulator
MPYEVIKTVGRRSYRYSVETVRDPKTGKKKARWTYVGRVNDETAGAELGRAKRMPDRLLSALSTLLATSNFKSLTVEVVAKRAKTTHATFYRYFRNLHHLLETSFTSLQQSFPSLELHVTGDAEEERCKIRNLVESAFAQTKSRAGILKALIQARSDSTVLKSLWNAHVERLQRAWSVYIGELNAAGLGRNDAPERLAELVVMCIQARLHDALLRNRVLTVADSELLAAAVSRLIMKD